MAGSWKIRKISYHELSLLKKFRIRVCTASLDMALIEMSSIQSSEKIIRSMKEEETICTEEDALLCPTINTSLSGNTSIRPEPEAQNDSDVSESGYISGWENRSGERTAGHLDMSTLPLPLSTTPLQLFLANLIWYRMHRDNPV